MKPTKRIIVMAFALTMALMLAACEPGAGSSASSSAEGDSASASSVSASSEASEAAGEAEASQSASSEMSEAVESGASAAGEAAASAASQTSAASEATRELVGKPWVMSILDGNLPETQPEAKDDLYTHFNYDYLAAHQSQPSSTMLESSGDLSAFDLAVIKDASKSNHDLDQLRIFFDQASDIETLHKTGLSEVQPYLDRIDAVTSIEEMNALLTADDFPFSPFVLTYITTNDTRETNIVGVNPNFALVDPILVGGQLFQDYKDPQKQQVAEASLRMLGSSTLVDLMEAGMSQDDAMAAFNQIMEFEKAHGKHADYDGKYTMQDFGGLADDLRDSAFTLDELCAACPNFPLKATLDKLGKGASSKYMCTREWLEAFNGLWTDKNLDTIKLDAKAKVLAETRPYRDPTFMNQMLEEGGQAAPSAESFAYVACDGLDTFSIVLAQTYVEEALGPNAKTRLESLSAKLVDTYKGLVTDTSWLDEESRQHVTEKLDHMTLNVLEPVGGYYDFGDVDLVPTDKGGTLFSNYLKLKQHRLDCESKMVGQPAVPASTWFAIKPTLANAFYDLTSNSINIYPGFVTSLLYADDMSEPDLLAGIGFTIGHEISHGFDYQGAQLDAYGLPNSVFDDPDVDAFVLKSSALAMYYQGIEIEPGFMVNGKNVVAEAASDLCGMQAILELAGKTEGVDYDKFFGKVSHVWAQVLSEAALQQEALDTHPLPNHRINVSSQMFDPIYDALGVSEGDGMYLAPDKRIVIWGPNA